MIEIRMHGRGGQGAVVATKLLAEAVFRDAALGRFAGALAGVGEEPLDGGIHLRDPLLVEYFPD